MSTAYTSPFYLPPTEPSNVVPKSAFKPLVWILKKAEMEDRSPMSRVLVAQALSNQAQKLYAKAGVARFNEYIQLAVTQGLIRVESGPSDVNNSQDSISLVKSSK